MKCCTDFLYMLCFDQQISQKERYSLSLQEFPTFLFYQPMTSLLALFLLPFICLLYFFSSHCLQIQQKLDPYFDHFFSLNFFRSHYDFFSNLYLRKAVMIHQHLLLHHPYLRTSTIMPYLITDLVFLTKFSLVEFSLKTCCPIHHYFKVMIFSLLSSTSKLPLLIKF